MSEGYTKHSHENGLYGVVFQNTARKVSTELFQDMLGAIVSSKEGGRGVVKNNVGFLVNSDSSKLAKVFEYSEHGFLYLLGLYGNVWVDPKEKLAHESPEAYMLNMVRSYIQKGTDFLRDIEGDFVVALWDGRKQTVVLATDPCRIYPLYYFFDQEKLIFSSRLFRLSEKFLSIPLTINPLAVVSFVGASYIPTPMTIFDEVQKLPPGQYLTYHNGKINSHSYWDMDYRSGVSASPTDLKLELHDTFRRSIRKRMGADDNPDAIGTFLSGGMDSSTITGVLSEIMGTSVKAFTIGFAHEQYDEADYARCVARAFHSNHFEYVVTPEDTYNAIPHLVTYFDEPFGNASSIPTFFCSKLAKEHGVNILLAGDGGDELFAGNERYAAQKFFDYYQVIPKWMRQGVIEPCVSLLSGAIPFSLFRKGEKYIQRANTPYPDRLSSWGIYEIIPPSQLFHAEYTDALLRFHPNKEVFYHYGQARATTELDRQLYIDLKMAISDNDLIKVTTMTQAAGVDVRFPFLDRALMEFSAKIPADMKMKGMQIRSFFKWAYSDLLPKKIIKKGKHGFGLPISYWLKTFKPLNELMHDLVLGPRTLDRRIFQSKKIQELVRLHESDRTPFYGVILWNIMMLEMWLRQHEDR